MPGKIIADLAPTAENCRNSEGAFLELKDGSVLFAWSRYGVGDGDDGDACEIWGMVSRDDGETFGAPRRLIAREDVSDDTDNIMSTRLLLWLRLLMLCSSRAQPARTPMALSATWPAPPRST